MKQLCCVIITLSMILTVGTVLAQGTDQPLPPGDSPPPTVFDRISQAGSAEDFDSAAHVIVYDSLLNKVNELGISYIESYMLRKVLTEEGCRNLSVLTEGYEPLSSHVEIREVNIIRGDSAIPVPIDAVLDLPAPQSGIYWGDRIKMLQLPRLYVGDGIEVKKFRKGYSYALLDETSVTPDDERYVPPMPGEYFDIVIFESEEPIIRKKYVLQVPVSKRIHSEIYNGPMYSSTTYDENSTTYAWWITDVPAWEPEPSRPDRSDLLAKVVIATVESWEAKSRWFFDANKNQFDVTEPIQAKVDEIFATAGVTNGTEEEKAFELVHWVAQNIRYSGQTMGEGEGFTLHSGEMIFEQRSGVCKDIAGMLVTMMRAADMDSYAAMTMAGSRIEKVPADQFNHCVVALRKTDGRFVMYDPTWVPYYRDIWSKSESEQHYLIGSPEGQGVGQIDFSPAEESPLIIKSTAKILGDGTLEGTFRLDSDGRMDGRLRSLFSYYRTAELDHRLASKLADISNRVELLSYKHGDVHDFNKSMWWEISYRIPEYAMSVDGGLEFASPVMQFTKDDRTFFRPATYDWDDDRHDDLFFYSTQLLDCTETIRLPNGYSIADPVQSKEIDETYASFKGTSVTKGNKLTVTQRAAIKRRQIPPDGYDGFRKAIDEFKEYAGTVFRAEKGGAK